MAFIACSQCSNGSHSLLQPTVLNTVCTLACRLLCVEHVEENDKPCLYLVRMECTPSQPQPCKLLILAAASSLGNLTCQQQRLASTPTAGFKNSSMHMTAQCFGLHSCKLLRSSWPLLR